MVIKPNLAAHIQRDIRENGLNIVRQKKENIKLS